MSQTAPAISDETNPLNKPTGFKVWRPGTVSYRDALTCQEDFVKRRHSWPFDLLVLLEHPTIITLGRKGNENSLNWSHEKLAAAGIDCIKSRRGGDVTLHAPGQLVGYPIVELNHYQRDLHRFLRNLESVLIDTLADFQLTGERIPGKTGVWIDGHKIASIGIAVQHWISYHGFALNIINDLSIFETIIPCGLPNVTMTSMQKKLGCPVNMEEVTEALIHHFSRVMQRPLLGEFNGSSPASQTRLA